MPQVKAGRQTPAIAAGVIAAVALLVLGAGHALADRPQSDGPDEIRIELASPEVGPSTIPPTSPPSINR